MDRIIRKVICLLSFKVSHHLEVDYLITHVYKHSKSTLSMVAYKLMHICEINKENDERWTMHFTCFAESVNNNKSSKENAMQQC